MTEARYAHFFGGHVLLMCLVCAGSAAAAEPIVFKTRSFQATLGEDSVWQSLTETESGRSLLAADRKTPLAHVQMGGKTYSAESARREGNRLVVGFGGTDTRLDCEIDEADDWITFRLDRIEGARPERITFLRIGIAVTEHVGSRLNGAWDEQTAVVVRGANRQTLCQPIRGGGWTELTASAQDEPGPKLEGSAASLIVAATADVKAILGRYAEACGLPTNTTAEGVASKDTRMSRGSYWFLSFAENEVDQVIKYCRKTGFHQVMIDSGAWCTSSGHYLFNTDRYPEGIESLKRTVAKLHDAGILVGMHCFVSKVSKIDPYVTPVPDRRFLVDRKAVLAEELAADATAIRTSSDLSQWPGSPVAGQKVWEGTVEKHQEVIIDDEIIQYESIGPDGKWDTFLGCRRGAWGTEMAAYKTETECRHYAVDGCINGYIIDQETDLLDQVTDRLAEVFNACDFDMVYFDGCEDVDRRRFDYYAANFQAVAMNKFHKRPIIHKGGGFHHNHWHSFTSSATIDQYPGTYLAYLRAGGTIDQWPTCKDHIDRTAERVVACQDDMIPGELGWFGINPADGEYDGLQYDEVEYLMCKSLAYDAPISLQTSFARLEQHPLTEDILRLIQRYEVTRHEVYRTPKEALQSPGLRNVDIERLKQPGKDFVAWDHHVFPLRIVETHRPTLPENAASVRAFVGHYGKKTILNIWHGRGRSGELTLDESVLGTSSVFGGLQCATLAESQEAFVTGSGYYRAQNGRIVLPVDHRYRRYEFDVAAEVVERAIESAEFAIQPPGRIWIRATDFVDSTGSMTKGSVAGVEDPDAIGDFIVCTGKIDRTAENPSYCEYRVQIPKKGTWTLWAHVCYPRGGDMSFGLVPGGEEVTLDGNQVLGNCGVNDAKWHWTGRGGGVTTVPPGSPIRLKLEQGEFRFRIYPREGHGTAETNPRLDVMCLCESADDMPTVEMMDEEGP